MNISRREFLKLGGFSVLSAAAPPVVHGLARLGENPFDGTGHLADVIDKEARPLNLWEVSESRPRAHLMVGEWHTDNPARVHLRQNMSLLKMAGHSTLFMESFGTETEPLIKEYQRTGGTNREELSNHLYQQGILIWPASDLYGGSERNRRISEYLKVLDDATRAGIRVVPIDMPKKVQYANPQNIEVRRNKWMAEPIRTTLKPEGHIRGTIHIGNQHLDTYNGADVPRLAELSNVVTIDVSGARPLRDAAKLAGKENETFMIPNRLKFPLSSQPADWIAYIPATLKESY